MASRQTGALAFCDAAGKILTRERSEHPEEIKEVTISGAPTYEISDTFTLAVLPSESTTEATSVTLPVGPAT